MYEISDGHDDDKTRWAEEKTDLESRFKFSLKILNALNFEPGNPAEGKEQRQRI